MAGVAGDVILKMDREIAKQWVITFIKAERDSSSITPHEIYGILLTSRLRGRAITTLVRLHQ